MTNDIKLLGSSNDFIFENEPAKRNELDSTLFQKFEKVFEEADQNLKKADQAILKTNTGKSMNLHEMMIAMEKADISLRFLVQVRNKAVEAYQEIMRMQV